MSNAIKAAMQRSYAYVFTTLPINHIQDEFYETLKRMCLSLADTAVALTYVLMYLGLIFAKLVILVFPHAVKLGKVIVDFHATKLSRSDLILEGTSIAILVTCFVFRVRIQSAWKNFIKSVSAKSKVAARAAPHVLFFTAAVTFAILGRNFLIPLTHSAVMPVFTLILPLVATTRVLFQIKNMSEAECLEAINTKNLLWVIVAIYHSLVTFGSLIPFGSKMLTFLPYAKEMVIVVMVWVQLSPVFSKIVFESVISKIMVKLCGMLPAGYGVEQTNAKTGTFLSVLKMMYLVNDSQMSFLQALFQDTVATMLAIVCIFMPNPFATIGMVMIALLLPAFRTSSVVATASGSSGSSHELAKLARRRPESGGAGGGGGRVGSNAKEHSTGSSGLGVDHVLSTHWLRYWVCLSVLWCLRIYAVKMWPSIVIVTTLWLQHSYFQGSSKATSFIVDAAKAINERNKRIELERQGVVRTPQPAIAATPGGSRFTFAALFSRTPKKPINYDPDDEILTPIVESTRNRGANTRDSKDILESNETEEAECNLASGYDIAINEHKTYGESVRSGV